MDAEQIRREMKATRESIDRKLDILAVRAAEARDLAVQRSLAAVALGAIGVIAVRWFSHRRASRPRRFFDR